MNNAKDTTALAHLRQQAGQPSGYLGRVLGRIMVWHNQRDYDWTIKRLSVKPGERVLEVGYGPGHGINKLTRRDEGIDVTGVDHSWEMLLMAQRRNRKAIQVGHVHLGLGSVMQLPFADNSFDKAMSVNCIYFWDDPVHGLRELYHALRLGGCLAVTVRDRRREAYTRFNAEELELMFRQAGFREVSIKRNEGVRKPALCAIGFK